MISISNSGGCVCRVSGRSLMMGVIMSYSRLELNDKVAVVIGGPSGIGLAIAKGMAEAGAAGARAARGREGVEAAAAESEQRGRRPRRVASDLSDRASL